MQENIFNDEMWHIQPRRQTKEDKQTNQRAYVENGVNGVHRLHFIHSTLSSNAAITKKAMERF